MLKKTIKYTDYNGVEREDDFYFHLSKAELADWLTTSGNYTYDQVIGKLVKNENMKEVMQAFKDLIYLSYGEKSLDGKRFIKTPEVKANLIESEAYSELYMELLKDPKKAADFFTGIIPSDISKDVAEMMKDPNNLPDDLKNYASLVNGSEQEQTNVVPISNT